MNIRLPHLIYFLVLILVLRILSPETIPENLPSVYVSIKNHQFNQSEFHLQKNTQYIIYIHNQDATSEEFESIDLSIEKIIPGNSQSYIILPKLLPGVYKFYGEFHRDSAYAAFIVT